jgi:hypothetical protein
LCGAVSPKDGTFVYLIMPTSNTACFQACLDVLSRPTGARWRPQPPQQPTRGSDNVSLFFLPPYAPELDPKESLWDEIREKYSRTS